MRWSDLRVGTVYSVDVGYPYGILPILVLRNDEGYWQSMHLLTGYVGSAKMENLLDQDLPDNVVLMHVP